MAHRGGRKANVEGILAGLRADMDLDSIAFQNKTTRATIRRIARKHGITHRSDIDRRFVTEWERNTIHRMVAEGQPVSVICRVVHRCHGTVHDFCEREGLNPIKHSPGVPSKFRPPDDEKIRQWCAEKVGRKTMAKRLGVGISALYKRMGRLGLVNPQKESSVPQEIADRVFVLWHDRGWTPTSIARELGMDHKRVNTLAHSWCKKGLNATRKQIGGRKPTAVAA